MIRTSTEARRAALQGALAGLSAGLLLTVLMTAMSAARDQDVWYGIKGAAAPFLGERAMHAGFDLPAVVLGALCHFAVSAGWGVAFALLAHGLSPGSTLAAGVFWGFVVWLGMYYVVLPMVGLARMRHDAPAGRAIAFHVFYSLATAASLLLYRRLLGVGPGERRGAGHAHAT
jgi:hypothetical protein